ncbi:MAG TPA: DUF2000 domain-containing protein [Candidatus Paceibacterota bacterium]
MQDFTQRISIVVRRDIEPWQVTNTIGHIAAYLGNKIGDKLLTGESFTTKDGVTLPRNSQYPIIVLSADEKLHSLLAEVQKSGFLYVAYIKNMIDEIDDAKLEVTVTSLDLSDLDILGIGIFGPNETVKSITKPLKLWK